MLAKLICWLFGHKFMVKAFTGMTYRCLHAFRGEEDISLYVWRAQKYCIRCGKPNKNVIGKREKVDIKNITVHLNKANFLQSVNLYLSNGELTILSPDVVESLLVQITPCVLGALETRRSVKNTINYKWSSFDEWREQYIESDQDLRGCAYPMVRNAWRSAREVEE